MNPHRKRSRELHNDDRLDENLLLLVYYKKYQDRLYIDFIKPFGIDDVCLLVNIYMNATAMGVNPANQMSDITHTRIA